MYKILLQIALNCFNSSFGNNFQLFSCKTSPCSMPRGILRNFLSAKLPVVLQDKGSMHQFSLRGGPNMQVCRLGRTELNELNSFSRELTFYASTRALIITGKLIQNPWQKECHNSSKWIDEMFESLLLEFCKLGTLLWANLPKQECFIWLPE